MSDSIFNEQTTQDVQTPAEGGENPQAPANPSNLFADQLKSITDGSGRQKYADVQSALEAIPHANSHISNLTQELDQLKEELAKRKGAEEILASMDSRKVEDPVVPTTQGLDANSVKELVNSALTERETVASMQANQSKVASKLLDVYGDKEKADKAFIAKANELGVAPAELLDLAKRHPGLVVSHFKQDTTPAVNPTNGGGVNTLAVNTPNQNPERKSVMYGASTRDVIASYKAHAQN